MFEAKSLLMAQCSRPGCVFCSKSVISAHPHPHVVADGFSVWMKDAGYCQLICLSPGVTSVAGLETSILLLMSLLHFVCWVLKYTINTNTLTRREKKTSIRTDARCDFWYTNILRALHPNVSSTCSSQVGILQEKPEKSHHVCILWAFGVCQ